LGKKNTAPRKGVGNWEKTQTQQIKKRIEEKWEQINRMKVLDWKGLNGIGRKRANPVWEKKKKRTKPGKV